MKPFVSPYRTWGGKTDIDITAQHITPSPITSASAFTLSKHITDFLTRTEMPSTDKPPNPPLPHHTWYPQGLCTKSTTKHPNQTGNLPHITPLIATTMDITPALTGAMAVGDGCFRDWDRGWGGGCSGRLILNQYYSFGVSDQPTDPAVLLGQVLTQINMQDNICIKF